VRLVPPVRYPDHTSGGPGALEQGQKVAAGRGGPFGYHPYPAVLKVLRPAREAEFQRPCPRPPAEADTLDPALYPRGEPGLFLRDHGRVRGRGWHLGQVKADLFMNGSRRTAVPHLRHGWPARPYTLSARSK